MRKEISLAACLLAFLLTFAGAFTLPAAAQSGAPAGDPSELVAELGESFILYQDAQGETICRPATPAEQERMRREGETHVIYRGAPMRRQIVDGEELFFVNGPADSTGAALLPSAGLTIVLRGTEQLEANPTAKAAFIAAANRWEAIISTPITITLDVDYGPQFFGQDYGSTTILGQTGSSSITPSLSTVRQRLIATASSDFDGGHYTLLPETSIPAEYDNSTIQLAGVRVSLAQARALGISFNNPNNNPEARIGFNSNFGGGTGTFDFDPNDGITTNMTDFDSVVVHEIGHALGFTSSNGGASAPLSLTIWDLFRFRPTAAFNGQFGAAPRVMSAGGTQVFFAFFNNTFGSNELGVSTGGPAGDKGDLRQSSHWRADETAASRPFIGIMDPTLSRSLRRTMTENDIRALDLLGYSVVFNPTRPPNDDFGNDTGLNGASGTVTGTSVWATRQPGEPLLQAGFHGDKSVWFAWQAPTNGTATFDTIGSNYDTTLGVYTGDTLNTLAPCSDCQNDDVTGLAGGVSRVTFNTTAGTLYRVKVDGWNGENGSVQLNWTSSGSQPVASYQVTGRVTGSVGNPIAGVRVVLEGPNLVNGLPAQPVTTDSNGGFGWTQLTPGGNYTVRPDDARFIFTPATAVFNNISLDHSAAFVAALRTVSVTGRVKEGTQGLQGVLVGLYGQNGVLLRLTSTSTAAGDWTFDGVAAGQPYSVLFVKSGYAFSPPSLIFPVGTSSVDMGSVFATKTNAIERTDFFVTQHYRDFLGREPDASGLAHWTNEIEQCGLDLNCREVRRVNVSAAFFLSIEFQNTGYLAYRMYKAAYGDATEASTGLNTPVIRRDEFMQDAPLISKDVVVGPGDWQKQLEDNKTFYAQSFAGRSRFTTAFPITMSADAFVDKLNQNAGGVLTAGERMSLIAEASAGTAARASVLRKVAEHPELDRREKNRAFVLMQYYGYLRRNPNDAPEAALNFAGWNFWLGKLDEFNGDAVAAEMVKAFLDASEYRNRFAGQ